MTTRQAGLALVLGAATALGTAPAPAAQQAAMMLPATCDRPCLLKLADDYLAALVAHDSSRVPLASDARIVEQAKRIRAGEGLWKMASGGPTAFKLIAADAEAQQVAGIVMMQSDGKPAQVGFRLKLANGRITEAEHLLAFPREQFLGNLQTLRPGLLLEVPFEYADSRGRMIHIAKSYYDALDNNNGHLAPFAPDCERRENGMRTAPNGGVLAGAPVPGQPPRPPSLAGLQDCASQLDSGTFKYIDRIDNRRVEIADTVTGLAVGFSHFRHPMRAEEREYPIYGDPGRAKTTMNFAPFDLPAMHIYKIWGGQIHEIEAIGFQAPLDSPSGWE